MAAGSFFAGPTPRVFGHRGAAALAPEDTLASFALALALGADALELDVHGTRDGVVVVIHDAVLDRTTNGSGLVSEHTWHELQQLDAGCCFTRDGHDFPYRDQGIRVPTLETVLQRFPLACCIIEVKQQDPPIVEEIVRIIRQLNAQGRVLLATEYDPVMQHIRRHADGIATGFAKGEVADFISRLEAGNFDGYRRPGDALQVPCRFGDKQLITPASVAAAHECGLEVHAWTINDRDEMESLLAMGVDGIISDLPGLARVVADAWTRRRTN
jgi:glycerophosphoryl diester phosphodiesterase